MYIRRFSESVIEKLTRQFSVVLITGPRQAGKTTLLKHLMSGERRYVTLDAWEHRQLAQTDPRLFLEQHPPPVFIDEVQYAPRLFSEIKLIVDERQKNGLFWLSGSQQFPLMRNITESLAGRVAILKLLGFSNAEIHGKSLRQITFPWKPQEKKSHICLPSFQNIAHHIFRGGFPKLYSVKPKIEEEIYFSSYLQTYLERDVRDLIEIGNLREFERFIRVCAARTGQLLNLDDMSRDVGISPKTAKNWLSILEASFQIYLLQPYYQNITKRMIKTPKLYYLDTGMLAYLTGWKTPKSTLTGAMSGAFIETYIISEILKSYWHRGLEPPIWFWRTKEKEEVDILFEINGKFYPVEIKLASLPTKTQISNLEKCVEKLDAEKGYFLCFCKKRTILTSTIEMIPFVEIQ